MSHFDTQYLRQGGRCFLCGVFTLPQNLNRAHLIPRAHGGIIGDDWQGVVLAHPACNSAMRCFHAGSTRFLRWIKGVVNGKNPFDAARPIRLRRARQNNLRLRRDLSAGQPDPVNT
jgi:hypothetical protein